VEVRDNGNGQARFREGGGLEGLSDRLRTIGGELEIVHQPTMGSVLLSKFPVDINNG